MDLLNAIQSNDLSGLCALLHVDLTAVNRLVDGQKPIHLSAAFDRPELLDMLVAHGADINEADGDGRTPLHYAALHSCVKSAKRLIRHGAQLNSIDNAGYTPLVTAIRERTDEGRAIAGLLLDAGAAYDAHAAVANGDFKRLLEIVQSEPLALSKVPNPDYVLVDALIATDTSEINSIKVLQMLFDHGLKPTKRRILDQAENSTLAIAKSLLQIAKHFD